MQASGHPMMRRRQLPGLLWAVGGGLPLLPLLPLHSAHAAPAAPAERVPLMAPDWFVFLETGRPTPPDRAAVAAMQRGHIENFKRLFAEGQLFAAGPMRDPSGHKRGFVAVRAHTLQTLRGYFEPDDYVREGYMTLNAVPATAQRALNTEGIDASRIEELRILHLSRGDASEDVATTAARHAHLQGLLARGVLGAWYTLAHGPVAEVMFARGTDTAALQAAFQGCPGLGRGGVALSVWPQWLSPGVVR